MLGRIREIGSFVEAREKIVGRAIECLAGQSERLKQEEDIVRRQQQKAWADINRLIEVLKSVGAKGLASVEQELRRLEIEEQTLTGKLAELKEIQAPARYLR